VGGEVYGMTQMTEAHRTLPCGTGILVENRLDGRTAEVRITDRGPFVDDRILDLSAAAARVLGAAGPGVIPVRVRVIALPGGAAPGRRRPGGGRRRGVARAPFTREGEARGMAEQSPEGASRAVDLVGYQDGAVVSRIVVKQAAGNVTLFAFDAGQELSEHTAPYDALVQVLEGEAEVTIAGRPHRLRAGDLILMPANKPHAVRAPARFKMLLTMIRS
jgi:quercetin dioxygenase-like cupin family protein